MRSARAADWADFETNGTWPPPGYLGRSGTEEIVPVLRPEAGTRTRIRCGERTGRTAESTDTCKRFARFFAGIEYEYRFAEYEYDGGLDERCTLDFRNTP